MVAYYGDFPEDATVPIPFNTFDSNDPANSVTATDLVAADIFVHLNGSATAITTDGASIDIDAPGVGAHMILIDTSVDAAYVPGEYAVRINGVTVDGGTVNAWIGAFSIERPGGALALTKLIQAAVITNAAGDDVAADIIALKTVADAIPTTAMRGTDNVDTATMRGTNDAALASAFTFSKSNELDVNTKSINDAEVIGDGNSTPWDGV